MTSTRSAAALVVLTAGLAVAFVAGPPALAAIGPGGGFADERHLSQAVRGSFVDYWRSGDQDFAPSLARVVDYWFRYHLAKAAIAALLLTVLVALGVRLWRAFLRPNATSRVGLASAGSLVTALALASLAVVMANVQGVVAPFASLLPMLVDGPADAELAGTLAQVKQDFDGGRTQPALDVMVDDFARYHVAMAVIATIVAVALLGLSVLAWTRFARSDRRTRRVLASYGALSAVLALAVAVVAVANTTTAADPAPALQALFYGGW
jgi:hypothetical protein